MRRITILGSTGSIGRSALDVISAHRDKFRIAGLAAGSNIDLLEKQIRTFSPEIVAVADIDAASELGKRLKIKHKIHAGTDGISAVAAYGPSDFVLSAMVGFSGLIPTLEAIKAGKTIGLANKETLVTAGSIVMAEAERLGVKILPVDSEHSAIFQCLEGHDRQYLKKIILTASGGPFIGKKAAELKNIRPADALKHPNWKMGRKITIDSATLMNKGLEVIEAYHLFNLPTEKISVLIHPQSIVHSIIELSDGSMLAQASVPDMRGPIAYALSYPERLDNIVPSLELDMVGSLTFHKPDTENFPCLSYSYEAIQEGGTMPAVLNAANEAAVEAFLRQRIFFNDIPVIIKNTLHSHNPAPASELGAVVEADRWARGKAEKFIKKVKNKP